jgi:hypothetical protein
MREDEPDESTEIPVVVQDDYTNVWNDFSGIPNLSDLDNQISPSLLQDVQSSDGSAGCEIVTPQHYDFTTQDSSGMASAFDNMYVKLCRQFLASAKALKGTTSIHPSIRPSIQRCGISSLTSNLTSSQLVFPPRLLINRIQGSALALQQHG